MSPDSSSKVSGSRVGQSVLRPNIVEFLYCYCNRSCWKDHICICFPLSDHEERTIAPPIAYQYGRFMTPNGSRQGYWRKYRENCCEHVKIPVIEIFCILLNVLAEEIVSHECNIRAGPKELVSGTCAANSSIRKVVEGGM